MEFTDYADSPTRSGDLLSLQRQRILAAQIKDSELGEDDVLLPTADTFDSAVESSVCANESALMEMDEIISQIQLWRQKGTTDSNESEDNETNTEPTGSKYHSEAYDRLFKSHGGPESDAPIPVFAEKKYAADDEMIAKLISLQALIQESKSSASIDSHRKHVLEFQALMTTLQERYAGKLKSTVNELSDDSGSDSGDEGENNHTTASIAHKRSNNNYEDSQAETDQKPLVSPRNRSTYAQSKLETHFKTIDVEVRGENFVLSRQKENEVIQEGADLQLGMATLEDTLRDFSGDLDRLLG